MMAVMIKNFESMVAKTFTKRSNMSVKITLLIIILVVEYSGIVVS